MDRSYEKWEDNLSRGDFLSLLTPYEKLAVQFGNFNYQVQNGGFSQWVVNNYDDEIDDLENFINECDYDNKDIFMVMFDNYRCIKNSLSKLNGFDDFYYEDVDTRENHYGDYDSSYYQINDEWENYFNDYLLNNIPNEYYQMIVNYEMDKPSI